MIHKEGKSLYKNNRREARNSNARTRIKMNAMLQSVDEIILFFNEIRLIMIFPHFTQLYSLTDTYTHIHIHTFLPILSILILHSLHSFHSSLSFSLPLPLILSLFRSRFAFLLGVPRTHCTTVATIIIVVVI